MIKKPDFTIKEIRLAKMIRVDFKKSYREVAKHFEAITGKKISYRTVHKWETEWSWTGTIERYKVMWEDYIKGTRPVPVKPIGLMTTEEIRAYREELEEWHAKVTAEYG